MRQSSIRRSRRPTYGAERLPATDKVGSSGWKVRLSEYFCVQSSACTCMQVAPAQGSNLEQSSGGDGRRRGRRDKRAVCATSALHAADSVAYIETARPCVAQHFWTPRPCSRCRRLRFLSEGCAVLTFASQNRHRKKGGVRTLADNVVACTNLDWPCRLEVGYACQIEHPPPTGRHLQEKTSHASRPIHSAAD